MQTGLYAGRRVSHQAQGKAFDKPFKYRDLGSAAYISRGKAVVSAFKLNFGGFLGWWVWLFIHIGFLTGYRNRIGAMLGWWFAFTRDLRRERTFTIDDMPLVRAYGRSLADPADAAPAALGDRGEAGPPRPLLSRSGGWIDLQSRPIRRRPAQGRPRPARSSRPARSWPADC